MYSHARTVMHSDHCAHFLSVYCSPLSVPFSSPSISYLYSHSFQFIPYYYYNNVRTVLSWKGKSGLSIEYLLGCGEASTPPERYVRMYEHIHTYTHIHRHTHTHTHKQIHTYTYINTHTHTRTHTYAHIHTHTYIHTHTCIHIHAYTYIHIQCHYHVNFPYGSTFHLLIFQN